MKKPLSKLMPRALILILVANILPELWLQLADFGVIDPSNLRALVYRLAAFQPDLANNIGPVFPGQTFLMFFTYGFVHTGILHFTVNMVGLIWLGTLILSYRRTSTFLLFYLLSMVGAAQIYALIGPANISATGASGALFGLLGVYVMDHRLLNAAGEKPDLWTILTRLIFATLVLALCDLVSQTITRSGVAWQAHMGGFFTGAVVALLAPPRSPPKAA